MKFHELSNQKKNGLVKAGMKKNTRYLNDQFDHEDSNGILCFLKLFFYTIVILSNALCDRHIRKFF